jgi:hypothetical protein
VPHATPDAHDAHATPPWPQPSFDVPDLHSVPSQHPEHDVGPHVHVPATQRCPVPQPPSTHTLAQPSLSPHALPAQLPVHAPAPHTLAIPPPPHVSPMLHPPQSTIPPQALLRCPHLPAHSLAQPPSGSAPTRVLRSSKPHTAEHAATPMDKRSKVKSCFMASP